MGSEAAHVESTHTDRVGAGCSRHPTVVSIIAIETMFDSNPNDLEGIVDIKEDVEEAILLHCWSRTNVCPACECQSTLEIGVETGDDSAVTVPDCPLCNAIMQNVAGDIEIGLQ